MNPTLLRLLICLVVSVSPLASQTPSATVLSSKDSGLVRVQFLILDGHEHPATTAPTNITILDKKQPTKSVASLHVGSEVPLRLGLLLDTSTSATNSSPFEEAIGKSVQFVKMALINPQDKAFVLKFSKSAQATEFMDREQFLSFKLDVAPGDGTALYDSIILACSERMHNIRPSEAVHLVLIVISDGEDNRSHVSRVRTIAAAQQAGVVIFTISGDQSGARSARPPCSEKELADATGGESFAASRSELSEVFRRIQLEIANTYVAIYAPADDKRDNRFRPVEVKISDKKLRARAPRGYFSEAMP